MEVGTPTAADVRRLGLAVFLAPLPLVASGFVPDHHHPLLIRLVVEDLTADIAGVVGLFGTLLIGGVVFVVLWLVLPALALYHLPPKVRSRLASNGVPLRAATWLAYVATVILLIVALVGPRSARPIPSPLGLGTFVIVSEEQA